MEGEAGAGRRARTAIRWLAVTATLTPIVYVTAHVARHGVDVPVFDQWQVQVPVAIAAAEGTLSLADLLQPYNEHRYVLVRLLTAVNTAVLGWSLRLEMLFNVALVATTLVLVIDLARRQQRPWVAWLAAPVLGLLLFSMRQHVAWTWSLMMGSFLTVLFVAAGLWLVASLPRNRRTLWLAMLCALLATLSSAAGVLAWPVLAFAAGARGYRRWSHALPWVVVAVTVTAGVHSGVRSPQEVPALLDAGRYALAFLGSPLVHEAIGSLAAAKVLGAVGLLLLAREAVALRAGGSGSDRAAIWLSLGLFSLGCAALLAFGRGSLQEISATQPLRSRYVVLATPLWLTVVVAAVSRLVHSPKGPRKVGWRVAVDATVIAGVALASLNAARTSAALPPRANPAHVRCLHTVPERGDASCLADVVYGTRIIVPRIEALARNRLAAFARE